MISDPYTVPDILYTQELAVKYKDKFEGYRQLSEDDYVLWQIAVDDANG
jgi:hypothetical protein